MRDTAEERIAELEARLVPAGTPMWRVAVEYRGLTIGQWTELWWLRMRAEVAKAPPKPSAPVSIASARDNYGWRSLPSGSRMLDRG